MLSLLLTANAERLVLKSDYRLRDAAAAAAFAAAAAPFGLGLPAAPPLGALSAFLGSRAEAVSFAFDSEALEILDANGPRENFAVGGRNRWRYSDIAEFAFYPSSELPLLVYFAERSGSGSGASDSQGHLFPVLCDPESLVRLFEERVGASKRTASPPRRLRSGRRRAGAARMSLAHRGDEAAAPPRMVAPAVSRRGAAGIFAAAAAHAGAGADTGLGYVDDAGQVSYSQVQRAWEKAATMTDREKLLAARGVALSPPQGGGAGGESIPRSIIPPPGWNTQAPPGPVVITQIEKDKGPPRPGSGPPYLTVESPGRGGRAWRVHRSQALSFTNTVEPRWNRLEAERDEGRAGSASELLELRRGLVHAVARGG
ncbi:hypothetical protein EMIHUDRAFT_98415 [Emiliania huxleyi CCMP1516]|uniref:Uncharacterized protein n=2 Tax=Emiliania huxleyi TaxID=2903 RepID=A0A0D3KI00_EMIH1|nr:hypothetical protein EMIHUDRAFT_98415 [Emiliania huxleyi CCMP1516]EOD35385.1 hypothetical protein EMIHUDRAFT_98415 [Emiliania huxleyi CCMP1516]|eukprot:XP_005787814.1 hypothetical protein EMIHUDRAFT_98415 [Emiliania huxleyi CCMP1516]